MAHRHDDGRKAERTRVERRRGPRWERRVLTDRGRHDQRSVDHRDPPPRTPAEWEAGRARPGLPFDDDPPAAPVGAIVGHPAPGS
ncbi:MAG: hypothetical protein JWO31_861, partial [Phycisphaerales bacterium]|nr:hypothetical protein [Phycisphaerales bacterium]